MTLLIAGYTFDHELDSLWNCDENNSANSLKKNQTRSSCLPICRKAEPSGIFVAADSTITSDKETLLNNFRKIYPVSVKLWEPYFVDTSFKNYNRVHQEIEIVVGFAGSTLTAQHCLNGIYEHLSKLRISCKPSYEQDPIQYTVLMDCERNPLHDKSTYWAEDTFTESNFHKILTAEYISEVALHSLKASLSSARKYKISSKGFQTLLTPFITGIQCPVTQKFYLYAFRMKSEIKEEIQQVNVEKEFISHDKVAVLGLAKEFEDSAQSIYTCARNAGKSTEDEIFNFLKKSIDNVQKRGDRSIDYPAVLKVLSKKGLRTASVCESTSSSTF